MDPNADGEKGGASQRRYKNFVFDMELRVKIIHHIAIIFKTESFFCEHPVWLYIILLYYYYEIA